jgi:hypothetical protein
MSYYVERREPSRMPEWYEHSTASMFSIRSILTKAPGENPRNDVVTKEYDVKEVKGDRAGTSIMEADERLLRDRVFDLKPTYGSWVENLSLGLLEEQVKLFSALGKGRPCILANRTATSILKDGHYNDIYTMKDADQYKEILGCPFFTTGNRYRESYLSVVTLVADQSITYSDDLPKDFEYDVELAGVRHFRFGPGLVELRRDSLQGTTSAVHHVAFSVKPIEDAPVWKLWCRM